MTLPLFSSRETHNGIPLVRVSREGALAVADRQPFEREAASRCGVDIDGRVPDRLPTAGEQFRFHIDMSRCIGCKCCVVACNEQNGNPASIQWRRVGEVEGGSFPLTRRAYFSMGCNHCADPTCLAGCPVDAYSKDEATGIVRHSAETCIGCQYCTWTCSYGVPQFNPERGVVGKCDMCYGRLSRGQSPACVSACPEGALAIEIVNVADWRASVAAAAAGTGRPASDASVSTSRVTLPPLLPSAAQPVDLDRLEPAEAHLPLVVMTVLTQLSAGAFAAIWIAQLFGASSHLGAAAAGALGIGGLALAVAALHLGRPIHAYRAMRMWRRSWLSREAVLFFAFVHAAAFFTAALWFGWPGAAFLGGATTVLGLAGVVATGCIYLVPSRPAWNTSRTIVQFLLTGTLLGALTAAMAGVGNPVWFRATGALTAIGLAALIAYSYLSMASAASIELRGTARLLGTTLACPFAIRLALLAAGGVVMPASSRSPVMLAIALVLALSGELLGRYLFFVSVVPRHMTASYLPAEGEAA